MIHLTPDHHEALRRVVAAGSAGLPLEQVSRAAAITLALCDLAEITKPPGQRVIATRQGAAFARRQVFA